MTERFVRLVVLWVSCWTCGCGPSFDSTDAITQVESGLEADTFLGGMKRLVWRGHPVTTGGAYYLIASCTGEDNRLTNIESHEGNGILSSHDGQHPCGLVPYRISFSGANPIRVTIDVGPTPQPLGALSFALDLEKAMFPEFDWNGDQQGWWEGCANDWQRIAAGRTGLISNVRHPCLIWEGLPGGERTLYGAVGLAGRPLAANVSMTLKGPYAQVTRRLRQVSVRGSNGPLSPRFTALSDDSGEARLEGQAAFVNHPGTAGLGGDLYRIPAGTVVRWVEDVSVNDPAVAPSPPCTGLETGWTLGRGQQVSSCNKSYQLVHQWDGNVVLYPASDRRPLWSTGTAGAASGKLAVQQDGNLVLYGAYGESLWQTATSASQVRLTLQDDGNLVLRANAGNSLWESRTYQRQGCGILAPGQRLSRGSSLRSCDGRFQLSHQTDGNVVLYRQDGWPLWQTATDGTPNTTLVMQKDGNLVLYDGTAFPLWSTGTYGQSGAVLSVGDDGRLRIYGPSNELLWSH